MSDFEMPQSIINRLMKDGQVGTENLIISKDVKKAFQQISGLFTLYLYSM